MKIIATSDLHGHLPNIEQADIVCIVGDISPRPMKNDIQAQWQWFNTIYLPWVESLPSRYVITVAGNHDKFRKYHGIVSTAKHIYLENSGVQLEGYSFYGTPHTIKLNDDLTFKPLCEKSERIFGMIPSRVDFLLSHSSPYGANNCGALYNGEGPDIGCRELTAAIRERDIKYIFCGHIHTGNHTLTQWEGRMIANVAYTDEHKLPAFEPLVLEL